MNRPDSREVGRTALLGTFERMSLIRAAEDRCLDLFRDARVRGAMHLCSGQEAVAVGTCNSLNQDDRLLFTYRSHGWALARGMSPERMFGEIFGRAGGCGGGRGGSKHMTDWSLGIFPSNAIVAAGLPLANGVALAAVRQQEPRVVVCAFGEGATNQGVVYEAMAQAVVWNLPVIFLCENNLYAEVTPAHEMRPTAEVVELAGGSGIHAIAADGMDVLAVEEALAPLVDRARNGGGPSFVELKTYRFEGHMTGDFKKYRTAAEIAEWRERDPILLLGNRLRATGVADEDLVELTSRAQSEIDAAIDTAWSWPEPTLDSISDYTSTWGETTR